MIAYTITSFFSIRKYMEHRQSRTMLTPAAQIASHNYAYHEDSPKPCAFFWKELLLHAPHTPSILIPDTLVVNLKEQPLLWVYTNKNNRI